MALPTLAFPSLDTPIIDPPVEAPKNPRQQSDGTMSRGLYQFLLALVNRVQQTAQALPIVSLAAGQHASIGTTAMPLPSLPAGIYRVSVRTRITQAASTSSSLTATVSSIDGGVTSTQSGPALTGNTTATAQSQVFVIRVDGATPISYAFTYASVGGTPMQYEADVVAEQIS